MTTPINASSTSLKPLPSTPPVNKQESKKGTPLSTKTLDNQKPNRKTPPNTKTPTNSEPPRWLFAEFCEELTQEQIDSFNSSENKYFFNKKLVSNHDVQMDQ